MTILPRGVGLPVPRLREFESVSMRFAQLVIGFRPRVPSVRFSVSETHWPFIVTGVEPNVELVCEIGSISRRPEMPTYSIEPTWDIWRAPDRSEEMIFYRGTQRIPSWRLWFDSGFRRGEVTQSPVGGSSVFRADDSPMLPYLVVRALGRLGALVIHASTAIVDGEALVFVGHSGAGKSTIARIAEESGARIPTDDRTILTFENGRITAWGSPWYGSLVRKTPEGAPLRRVFLLEQAGLDRVEPIPAGRAVKELFVRLVQPRLDALEIESALARLEELVRAVPVSMLHFLPTAGAFDLAKRVASSD